MEVDVDVDVRRPLRRRRRRNMPGEGDRESCEMRLSRCSSSYVTSMSTSVGPLAFIAGGGGDDSGIFFDDAESVDIVDVR